MKNFKSHFKFNKQEQSGIFYLLLIIVVLQISYFTFHYFFDESSVSSLRESLEMQTKIDALKTKALQKNSVAVYPFNPNYITDYKGFILGMSTDEIDRLLAFREKGAFVNSAKEFQKVTQISDSLLGVISSYFKFPDWVRTKKRSSQKKQPTLNLNKYSSSKKVYKDLNLATILELREIHGIGEKLSARIVKFRDRLGGFLVEEQLYDVYGLESEVVERALKRFKVLNPPQIEKININSASVEMIAKLTYLQKDVAIAIVNYRNYKGSIESFAELSEIENFPVEKIDRIVLYLSL